MHIVEFGSPVEIFGLSIRQGDLLYADCHGVLAIPLEIAAELPDAAARVRQKEKNIIDVCQSADFSPDKLLQAIRENDQCKYKNVSGVTYAVDGFSSPTAAGSPYRGITCNQSSYRIVSSL